MLVRFVLLRHECPADFPKPSHWDFMLENEGVLLCWQLNELPTLWAKLMDLQFAGRDNTVQASRLADHRLDYLDYEGPISDNRGSVIRLDRGPFRWMQRSEGRFAVHLVGKKLSGNVLLDQQGEAWNLAVEGSSD